MCVLCVRQCVARNLRFVGFSVYAFVYYVFVTFSSSFPPNKTVFSSTADPDPHGSGTFFWIVCTVCRTAV